MAEQLHPEEEVTSIVFVRHGHTRQTEQGKLYCDHRALLTDTGRKQAESIAEFLVQETPDLLFASTAHRVRETADIVATRLSLSVQLVEGLDEQNVGEWEDRSYLEIKKSNPAEYNSWLADPIRNRTPAGESIQDVIERVNRDLSKLIEPLKGRKIVLVTHAGIIRSAVIKALEMPIENFWRISVPTGSASKVDYSSNYAMLHYMSLRFD